MTLDSLHIAKTEETPEVSFNLETGMFSIVGRSLPEDAFAFYKPIIEWIKDPDNRVPVGELTIHLDYFNSSSGRYIMEMLVTLESQFKDSRGLTIKWVVDEDDELMIEKGEEFNSLINLPFEVLTV
ncbi:MAG: DUF1987 domain-containing protein [Flavobacteriales bacterium]|nr:DUF1987 domain-containing protein [Flavobacteriales bacterium]